MMTFLEYTKKSDPYVYHATLGHHFESIYKHGLRSNQNQANWHFSDNPKNAVYFSGTSRDANYYGNIAARNHVDNLGWVKRPEVIMLRTRKEHVKLTSDNNTKGDYFTTNTVKPEHLEVRHQGEWKPFSKLTRWAVEGITDRSLGRQMGHGMD